MKTAIALSVATVALAACATAPIVDNANGLSTATSTSCAAEEFRQLDFWVGEWDVRWETSADQQAGTGRNIITHELDRCVIQEQFTGDASTNNLVGRSVSTYHAAIGQWRQTWVDNQGGYFALVGGPAGETFVLENSRLQPNAPYLRMVFEDITPTSLTWRWQRSSDAGQTWNDSWVIYYTRSN